MKKLYVKYDPEYGLSAADSRVSEHVDKFVNQLKSLRPCDEDMMLSVGTATFVDQFRLRVVRKEINHCQLVFTFKGLHIRVDQTGGLSDCPRGFCDHTEHALLELLQAE